MPPSRSTPVLTTCTCHTCGYSWRINELGVHTCVQHMQTEIDRLKLQLKTTARDQRHACAEAVNNIVRIDTNNAHAACMNAEVTNEQKSK